jgi:hypothetical protein
MRYGLIVPAYLDPHLKRSTLASIEFEFVFDREPTMGDILRFEHVATLHSPQANAYYFGEFIAAWCRQLPELECPLRFEDGVLLKRLMPGQRMQDARWKPDLSVEPDEKWLALEREMNQKLEVSTLDADEGSALTFLGMSAEDGRHRCRPATREEMMTPETDEFKRLYDPGVTHEQMSAKHWRVKTNEILINVFGP